MFHVSREDQQTSLSVYGVYKTRSVEIVKIVKQLNDVTPLKETDHAAD